MLVQSPQASEARRQPDLHHARLSLRVRSRRRVPRSHAIKSGHIFSRRHAIVLQSPLPQVSCLHRQLMLIPRTEQAQVHAVEVEPAPREAASPSSTLLPAAWPHSRATPAPGHPRTMVPASAARWIAAFDNRSTVLLFQPCHPKSVEFMHAGAFSSWLL